MSWLNPIESMQEQLDGKWSKKSGQRKILMIWNLVLPKILDIFI